MHNCGSSIVLLGAGEVVNLRLDMTFGDSITHVNERVGALGSTIRQAYAKILKKQAKLVQMAAARGVAYGFQKLNHRKSSILQAPEGGSARGFRVKPRIRWTLRGVEALTLQGVAARSIGGFLSIEDRQRSPSTRNR
uniref:Uncharacterized protein n=1 Tax=Ananas comosus var. bracteatus TaxID=296719 RepID=A0A6V7QGZ9_ANACO|nr:unnamed protein product [Ananas comosus var. bracteatus]